MILHKKARAKVNLILDVIGKRPDSYHDIDMIMHKINLYDDIFVEEIESGIELIAQDSHLPLDSSNIAYKAAKLVIDEYLINKGVRITIHKNIPIAAGLAGGSTDAAAVIDLMNEIFHLEMNLERKMHLGIKLGADVPFCFLNVPARARGIGEELELLKPLKDIHIVLTKPSISVSTKDVYENLLPQDYEKHPDVKGMLQAMESNNIYLIKEKLENVLEKSTFRLYPRVYSIKGLMKSYGAKGVLMSGSGPSVYGLFNDKKKAYSAYINLKKHNVQTYLTNFYSEDDIYE
jgi:4-diphosphocytidyl-2-C-methyl-D-erythritol kinase